MEYKPFVLVKLDKEREFALNNRALVYLDQINKGALMNMEEMGIADLNYWIYAGLKAKDKSLDFDTVVDLIDEFGDFEALAEVIKEAVESSRFLQRMNKVVPK